MNSICGAFWPSAVAMALNVGSAALFPESTTTFSGFKTVASKRLQLGHLG
jgi:hypothetical protein